MLISINKYCTFDGLLCNSSTFAADFSKQSLKVMKKIVFSLIVFTMTTMSAFAGGILTNTNQSVSFLKNPARDAAIGLDGVYSNPAGVAFQLAVCSPDTYRHFYRPYVSDGQEE